jgi:23S rRNA pseudouridine2604 synthase
METYPMRINKYLAHKGYATRTGADELIKKNLVFINGELAVLGDKVSATDTVEVRRSQKPKKYVYIAYNKPIGVISHSPQMGEKDVKKSVSKAIPHTDIFPVGRLDKDSHGLMILTNDGRITDRLLNPMHTHEKEYVVKTLHPINTHFKKIMESGVSIEGYVTQKCSVTIVNSNEFKIILSEGKKHQIRRMVVALKNDVTDLKRIRVMNITLGKLGTNQTRPIEGDELKTFLNSLGL